MTQLSPTKTSRNQEMASLEESLHASQVAQRVWSQRRVEERLRAVTAVKESLVDQPEDWAEEITTPGRRTLADSLGAEVMPMADACKFLEQRAANLLKPMRAKHADRPLWGRGLRLKVHRKPKGVVLIIGAWNYPLFLMGVQALQAVTAGNSVLIKPAPGCRAPAERLAKLINTASKIDDLVQVLDESPAAAKEAMALGVDHVVLTGSFETGQKVLAQTAETMASCTLELSGCDAAFVLPSADIERTAACLAFGLTLNGGATCIGPRRVYVVAEHQERLKELLIEKLADAEPVPVADAIAQQAGSLLRQAKEDGFEQLLPAEDQEHGAFPIHLLKAGTSPTPLLQADLFAPVMSLITVRDTEHALQLNANCPYGLGASIFAEQSEAEALASRIPAGCITINDLVAPTADPRLPFVGWNHSGFGATRGAEGLLELTRIQAVSTQTARWLPHLDPPTPGLADTVVGLIRMAHGKTWLARWRGLVKVIKSQHKK